MAKEKQLTENQKVFLLALVGDARGDFRTAMKIAGYSDNTSVAELVKSLRTEIRDAAKDALAMASIKAAFAHENVLMDPNMPGAGNVLKAAQSILDRVGVKDEDVGSNLPDGAVLILPEKKVTIIQVSDGDVQIGDKDDA